MNKLCSADELYISSIFGICPSMIAISLPACSEHLHLYRIVSRDCPDIAAEAHNMMGKRNSVGDANNSPLPCMLASLSSHNSSRSS